ncbi:MAG: TIGR02300 family protein [Rhodospirillaceae bacterium]
MAKPEWGTKRICPSCGARYYDLRKDPPVCPTCGAEFDPEALLKSRRARPIPADDHKKTPIPLVGVGLRAGVGGDDETVDLEDAEDVLPVEDIEEDADEEDVLIEDTSELGEDDMAEVVDVEGVGEDEEGR